MWRRSLRAHEFVKRPVQRKRTRIPQRNAVVVHPNLNRRGMGIVSVRDRIQHCFAQRLDRCWPGLAPVDALIGDFCP